MAKKQKTRDNFSISLRTRMVAYIDRLVKDPENPVFKGRSRSEAIDLLLEEALLARFGDKEIIKEIC